LKAPAREGWRRLLGCGGTGKGISQIDRSYVRICPPMNSPTSRKPPGESLLRRTVYGLAAPFEARSLNWRGHRAEGPSTSSQVIRADQNQQVQRKSIASRPGPSQGRIKPLLLLIDHSVDNVMYVAGDGSSSLWRRWPAPTGKEDWIHGNLPGLHERGHNLMVVSSKKDRKDRG